MDREEAVKRIKEIQKLYVFTPTINEALDLAIEALQKVSVYEQVKWERDQALETLDEHGIGLGQITGKVKNPCDSLLKPDSDECKEQRGILRGW